MQFLKKLVHYAINVYYGSEEKKKYSLISVENDMQICPFSVQFIADICRARRRRSAWSSAVLSHLCSHGNVHHLTVLGSNFRHCARL